MKKSYEPINDSIKDTSRDITKTMTESSIRDKKAVENINNKLLEMTNDRGILATSLMSLLSEFINPQHTGHFKLLKDLLSNRVNDMLINKVIPVTPYDNFSTFLDTDKKFELQGGLLKMITNRNYKVDLATSQVKKLGYEFAKELYFDERALIIKVVGIIFLWDCLNHQL